MTADTSGKELVQFAEQTAERLYRDNLKRTQIRNIFTETRKIEAMKTQDNQAAMRRLMMLKPKLAYQGKRHKEVSKLRDVLTEAIDYVVNEKDVEKQDKKEIRKWLTLECVDG